MIPASCKPPGCPSDHPTIPDEGRLGCFWEGIYFPSQTIGVCSGTLFHQTAAAIEKQKYCLTNNNIISQPGKDPFVNTPIKQWKWNVPFGHESSSWMKQQMAVIKRTFVNPSLKHTEKSLICLLESLKGKRVSTDSALGRYPLQNSPKWRRHCSFCGQSAGTQ